MQRRKTGFAVSYFGIFLNPQARTTIRSSLLCDALSHSADKNKKDGSPKLGSHSQLVVAN